MDLVILAKKGASGLSYHQVQEELGRLLIPGKDHSRE
jgi:RNase P protein component